MGIHFYSWLAIFVVGIHSFPDSRNPNLEYEIINPKDPQPKPALAQITTTPRNVVINTPPPPPLDSKTFAYDPISKSWTQVKDSDPKPDDSTLLWNQSNDKWLTMAARY